jgi:hypothetical protein
MGLVLFLPHKSALSHFILGQLRDWARGLPAHQDVEHLLDEQAARIDEACRAFEGMHRWVDGKTVLSSLLHPQVFHAFPLSAGDLRRYLAEAVRDSLPVDIHEIARQWQR